MACFAYCGLILDCEWSLPELPELPLTASPDIRIRTATVPLRLAEADVRRPIYEINKNEILYRLDGIARYRILENGQLIEVEPDRDAEPSAVALFLLHPVFVLACVRRGDWMLAASAVVIEGRAFAFTGPSAWGKSSVAAGLALAGHGLLADGLLRVERCRDGVLLAHPQANWVLVWPDLRRQLHPEKWQNGSSVRSGLGVRRFAFPAQAAVPLEKIAHVRWEGRPDADFTDAALSGNGRSFEKVRSTTAGGMWLTGAGSRPDYLRWAATIAAQCPIDVIPLPWGWGHYDSALSMIAGWASPTRVDGAR